MSGDRRNEYDATVNSRNVRVISPTRRLRPPVVFNYLENQRPNYLYGLDDEELGRIREEARARGNVPVEIITTRALGNIRSPSWFQDIHRRAFSVPNEEEVAVEAVSISQSAAYSHQTRPVVPVRFFSCRHLGYLNLRDLDWVAMAAGQPFECPYEGCSVSGPASDLLVDRFLLYIMANRHLPITHDILVGPNGDYQRGRLNRDLDDYSGPALQNLHLFDRRG